MVNKGRSSHDVSPHFSWVTSLGTLEKGPLGCGHSLHTVGFQSPRWAFKTCSGLPKIWGPFFWKKKAPAATYPLAQGFQKYGDHFSAKKEHSTTNIGFENSTPCLNRTVHRAFLEGWIRGLGKGVFGMWAFKAHHGLSKPIVGFCFQKNGPEIWGPFF